MQQFEMEDVTRAALDQRGYDMTAHHLQRAAMRAKHEEDAETEAPRVSRQPRLRIPRFTGLAHGFRLAHWHR